MMILASGAELDKRLEKRLSILRAAAFGLAVGLFVRCKRDTQNSCHSCLERVPCHPWASTNPYFRHISPLIASDSTALILRRYLVRLTDRSFNGYHFGCRWWEEGGLVRVYRKNGGQGLLNIEASFVTFHYLILRIVKSNRNTFL
jgi:hypothetical protein